jgi:hypothetical protein
MSGVLIMTIDYFPDPLIGKPISQGKIYVGEPDTDPTVPANQKTMTVLEEDGSLTNVTQPLRTSAGGVPVYNGSPVSIYVALPFSVTVLRSDDTQAYYIPSMGATDVIGDVLSTDGTKVLENGTDGTDATFTGDVTGDLTGAVTGDVTGDLTGDIKADDGTVVIDPGTIVSDGYIKSGCSFADSTDTTKKVQFDISGATTGKKATIDTNHTLDRTHTLPNKTGTIAHTSDLTFSESFTSSAQTISAAGLLTVPHSLSAVPYNVSVSLKNTTGEHNWSVGDEILVPNGAYEGTSGADKGFAIWVDSTNVNIRFSSAAAPFDYYDKTAGTGVTLTNGSWELYIRAWA